MHDAAGRGTKAHLVPEALETVRRDGNPRLSAATRDRLAAAVAARVLGEDWWLRRGYTPRPYPEAGEEVSGG